MQYAILCYHSEDVVCAWTKEEDDAVMAKLAVVQGKWVKSGKLGPVARLMPTTAATTLRKDQDPPLVVDGPFAETKEQLLGFYIVDASRSTRRSSSRVSWPRPIPAGPTKIRPVARIFYSGTGTT